MQLEYLIFDFTDEETGAGSFDAMASVLPARLPALAAEIEGVLQWAWREFGAPSGADESGQWAFELQATGDHQMPLEAAYDVERGKLSLPHGTQGRVTLSLTLSGSQVFCEAFNQAFPASD